MADLLDELSFAAPPGSAAPSRPVGRAARAVAGKLLEHTQEEQESQTIE